VSKLLLCVAGDADGLYSGNHSKSSSWGVLASLRAVLGDGGLLVPVPPLPAERWGWHGDTMLVIVSYLTVDT